MQLTVSGGILQCLWRSWSLKCFTQWHCRLVRLYSVDVEWMSLQHSWCDAVGERQLKVCHLNVLWTCSELSIADRLSKCLPLLISCLFYSDTRLLPTACQNQPINQELCVCRTTKWRTVALTQSKTFPIPDSNIGFPRQVIEPYRSEKLSLTESYNRTFCEPTLLPRVKRPSFTPIQNSTEAGTEARTICLCLFLNICSLPSCIKKKKC